MYISYFILFNVYIVSHDLWYYFFHRLLHTRHMYFIHKKHHKKLYSQFTYLDAYVGEIIEFPLETMGVCIPLLIKQEQIKENTYNIFFCALLFIFIRNLMQHDKKFIWLVGEHHLLHHKLPNYNYGECWIDKICGTNYK